MEKLRKPIELYKTERKENKKQIELLKNKINALEEEVANKDNMIQKYQNQKEEIKSVSQILKKMS